MPNTGGAVILQKKEGYMNIYGHYNIVEGLMRAITRCWWCAV